MIKKKIDERIEILIDNGIKQNERVMFIIVGDHGRNQIPNIHYINSKKTPGKKNEVLWCYRKDLGFSSQAKKKIRKIKNQQDKGVYDVNKENSFDLFVASNDIKYSFYHETQKILGNTFNFLILQDFEAVTPNLLCRTIETVSGGGIIIFLFNTMTSLKQLYTLSMEAHSRFRTESHKDVEPRFNERFILSLANCNNCLVMDDELNILPISSQIHEITAKQQNLDFNSENIYISEKEKELNSLKISLRDKAPVGNLVGLCKTIDQAKCVMTMIDSIAEKINKSTVSITASRGRGKSSAMGLAIASAIVYGFSNIFVTAPSPENLKTFFEFIVKGLIALNYKEHLDFQVQVSNDEEYRNMIIRINVFRDHKQTISYIKPNDVSFLNQAELIVIDEAAAIPLHVVRNLLAPCLVFLASTIHGYEGTGRSLSLKLLKQLREQTFSADDNNTKNKHSITSSKTLKEIKLEQAIRYADFDPIEAWLNNLLCLDATNIESIYDGFPHPKECDLYLVNRDTLFSYNKGSELFLRKIMSLFISSHYKNSPNDLQLLSDAPAHSIFILTKSIDKKSNTKGIPEIFAAIQVCQEGGINKSIVIDKNKRGFKPPGDLIPWTVAEHYQTNDFPNMSGIRVVRIAVHPDSFRMGYGTRALDLLSQFYEGKIINLDEAPKELIKNENQANTETTQSVSLKNEVLKPKKKLPPLLTPLSEVVPPFVYWLGTAFGLTKELFGFWKKSGYHPIYLKLAENDITGEHSTIMIKPLRDEGITYNKESGNSEKWLIQFSNDFKKRFLTLLGYEFRNMSVKLALSLLDPQLTNSTHDEDDDVNDNSKVTFQTKEQIDLIITKYDYNRLDKYTKNQIKYQLILDLIPDLAKFFFLKRFGFTLSYTQAAILLSLGLQYKNLEEIQEELNVPLNQILAMFNKSVKKFTTYIKKLYEKEIDKQDKKIEFEQVILPKKQITTTMKEDLVEDENRIISLSQKEKLEFFKEKEDKTLGNGNKKRERSENGNENENLNNKRKKIV